MKKYLLYLGLFAQLSLLGENVSNAERLAAVQQEIAGIRAQIAEFQSKFGLPESKDVTIESISVEKAPFKEATEQLIQGGADVEFVLSEEARGKTINITLRGLPLTRMLQFITQQVNLDWMYHDNRIYVFAESGDEFPDGISELVAEAIEYKSRVNDLVRGDLRKALREERNIERTLSLTKSYDIKLDDGTLTLLRGNQLVTKGMYHNGSVYFLYENVIDHSSDIGMPPDVPESVYTTPLGNLYHWSPALNLKVKSKSGVGDEPIYFTKFHRYKNDEGEFPAITPDNEIRFSCKTTRDLSSSNERRHHTNYDIVFHDVASLDGFLEKYIDRDLSMVVYLYVDLPIEVDYLTGLINDLNELQHPFYLVIRTSSVDNTTDYVSDLTSRYMDLKESYYDKTKAEWDELLLYGEGPKIKFRRRRSYLFKQGYDTEFSYSFDAKDARFKSVTFFDADNAQGALNAFFGYRRTMKFYLYDNRYLRIIYDIQDGLSHDCFKDALLDMEKDKIYNLTDSGGEFYLWDFDPEIRNNVLCEYRQNSEKLPEPAFKFDGLDGKEAIPLGTVKNVRNLEFVEDAKPLKGNCVDAAKKAEGD